MKYTGVITGISIVIISCLLMLAGQIIRGAVKDLLYWGTLPTAVAGVFITVMSCPTE